MSRLRAFALAAALSTTAAIGGLTLFTLLTANAVQNPSVSFDMVTTGNTYDESLNSMAVGSIENCLTSATANPNTHIHAVQLVVQNVEDLVGWQARMNYLGDQMRPNTVNFSPFTDNNTGQNVSFLNLPIDQTTIVHRDLVTASDIPAGAAGPQSALVGAVYNGAQDFAISPDSPHKAIPDDASYDAPTGGVLASMTLQVLAGNEGNPSLFVNMDDASPNPPGTDLQIFTATGLITVSPPVTQLGDAYHGEGAPCVPLDCTTQECPGGTVTPTPEPETPTPTPCIALPPPLPTCAPTVPSLTETPTATATASPTAPATEAPTETPTPTPSPAPTSTATIPASPTPSPSPSPSPTATASPTASPTPDTPTPPPPSPTGTCCTPSPSPTPTATPTATATASPTPTATESPTPTPSPSPTATPTPAPVAGHDARLFRMGGVPKNVRLSPGEVITDSASIVVSNDSDHTETIGVYVDVLAPSGCTPNGRVLQTTVALQAGKKTTIPVPVDYNCSDLAAADGLSYAWTAAADHGADDLSSCGPGSLQGLACFNALANDDEDPADNRKSRSGPRVIAE